MNFLPQIPIGHVQNFLRSEIAIRITSCPYIGPYTVEDRGKFERADGAEQKVLDWIEKSEEILLFLPEILDPVRARYLTPTSSEYQSPRYVPI